MGKIFNKIEKLLKGKKEKPETLERNDEGLVRKDDSAHQRISVVGPFDDLLPVAVEVILEYGVVSVALLQRKLQLSYGRAAKLVDEMETHKIVGPFRDGCTRDILCKNYYNIDFLQKEYTLQANSSLELGGSEDELLSVDLMSGFEFESWCANLLLRNGFEKATVTPGSGDFGVDIVAVKDGIYYAVQCKCYSGDIGNHSIQEVYAGKEMYKCQVGVVMTNRHFTSGAKQLAEQTRVLLWDRSKLKSLIESAS